MTKRLRHAILSASGSATWIFCAGSVHAQKGRPNKHTPEAYEGTCGHTLSSTAIENEVSCYDLVGEELTIDDHDPDSPFPDTFTVSDEMAYYCQQYVDRCLMFGDDYHVEVDGDYTPWVPEGLHGPDDPGGFGQSDFVAFTMEEWDEDMIVQYAPGHELMPRTVSVMTIRDLKYGRGVPVYAEGNTQGILYALAMYNMYSIICDFDFVRIEIDQPRIDGVSSWIISVDDLLQKGEELAVAARATVPLDAPRTAGRKQCMWCKAKNDCPALKNFVEEVALQGIVPLDEVPDDLFEDGYTGDPQVISIQQASIVERNRDIVEGFLKANKQRIEDTLNAGEDVPGFKMVEGRSSRKYDVTEQEMEDIFRRAKIPKAKTHKTILKTGPAMETEFKSDTKINKILEKHLKKPKGSPTLAQSNDKRPALVPDMSGIEVLDK